MNGMPMPVPSTPSPLSSSMHDASPLHSFIPGLKPSFSANHKPRLRDVAAKLKRSAHAALGLAINCAVIPVAGQRTHGATFRALKVASSVATAGAESAVYDCLVVFVQLDTGYLQHVYSVFERLGYETDGDGLSDWTVLWSHVHPFTVLSRHTSNLKPHQKVST